MHGKSGVTLRNTLPSPITPLGLFGSQAGLSPILISGWSPGSVSPPPRAAPTPSTHRGAWSMSRVYPGEHSREAYGHPCIPTRYTSYHTRGYTYPPYPGVHLPTIPTGVPWAIPLLTHGCTMGYISPNPRV